MSIQSLCTGDFITPYSIAESGWSSSITGTAGTPIECRIDTQGVADDASNGKNDTKASYVAFFSSNPSFAVGKYAKWTKSGGVTFGTPKYLRCTGAPPPEGRPGVAQLWYVMFEQTTADGIEGVLQ